MENKYEMMLGEIRKQFVPTDFSLEGEKLVCEVSCEREQNVQ